MRGSCHNRRITPFLPSGTAPTSVPRPLSLEDRVTHLESLLNLDVKCKTSRFNLDPTFDVEAFLSSPEGLAEFKDACSRFHLLNDRRPLEAFAKKTGGRMPGGSK